MDGDGISSPCCYYILTDSKTNNNSGFTCVFVVPFFPTLRFWEEEGLDGLKKVVSSCPAYFLCCLFSKNFFSVVVVTGQIRSDVSSSPPSFLYPEKKIYPWEKEWGGEYNAVTKVRQEGNEKAGKRKFISTSSRKKRVFSDKTKV